MIFFSSHSKHLGIAFLCLLEDQDAEGMSRRVALILWEFVDMCLVDASPKKKEKERNKKKYTHIRAVHEKKNLFHSRHHS